MKTLGPFSLYLTFILAQLWAHTAHAAACGADALAPEFAALLRFLDAKPAEENLEQSPASDSLPTLADLMAASSREHLAQYGKEATFTFASTLGMGNKAGLLVPAYRTNTIEGFFFNLPQVEKRRPSMDATFLAKDKEFAVAKKMDFFLGTGARSIAANLHGHIERVGRPEPTQHTLDLFNRFVAGRTFELVVTVSEVDGLEKWVLNLQFAAKNVHRAPANMPYSKQAAKEFTELDSKSRARSEGTSFDAALKNLVYQVTLASLNGDFIRDLLFAKHGITLLNRYNGDAERMFLALSYLALHLMLDLRAEDVPETEKTSCPEANTES